MDMDSVPDTDIGESSSTAPIPTSSSPITSSSLAIPSSSPPIPGSPSPQRLVPQLPEDEKSKQGAYFN